MAAEVENAGAIVPVGEARTVPPSTEIVAAGAAGSSTAAYIPDLEGLKKVITHTKAVGVILPPPDIRAIIDKTAQFVAKNGAEFEKRILSNEKNNVKFNFLVPTDPYHAYYKLRVKDFSAEDGQAPKDQGAAPGGAAVPPVGPVAAPAVPIMTAPKATIKPLEKPDDEMYTVHVPEGLTTQDLDIIKLTAQFVARNGKSFLAGLSSREHTNPQFNFLKPTHSLFAFFTSLADAYSRVMMPEKGLKERLAKDASDWAAVLDRALKRLEWDRHKEKEAQDAADEAERERQAVQAIDWHDFVVVETITFDDEEDPELPPPLTLRDVIAMNKSREAMEALNLQQQEAAAAEAIKEADMEMDVEERAMVAEAAAQEARAAAAAAANGGAEGPEGAAAAPAAATAANAAPEPTSEDMEQDMEAEEEEEEAPIKVVKNYTRQAAGTHGGRTYDPNKFVVSPITGELIPIEEMAEHMRISLIDPRWKEQRDVMLSKIRETTKATDDEITRNLVGLAVSRPDIFGSTEEELQQAVREEIKDKMMSGVGRPVAWDGATQGGEALQNQIRAIADNRADLAERGGAAGGPGGAGASAIPQAVQLGPAARPGGQLPPPPPPPGMGQLGGGGGGMMPPRQPMMGGPMGGPMGPPMGPGGMMRPPMGMMGPPMGMGGPMGHMGPMGMGPMGPMGMRPGMGGPMGMGPMGMGHMGMGPHGHMGPGGPMGPGGGMGMGAGMPSRQPGVGPGGPPPPPPPSGAAPPLPREAPPLPSEDQPDPKRARVAGDFVLQPEEEFLARFPGPGRVKVLCPEVEGSDKLIGQMLEVEVASLSDSVADFKSRLAAVLDLPANKQKLAREGAGFMRDELSLAHYNVSPDVVLNLGLKERGGARKK